MALIISTTGGGLIDVDVEGFGDCASCESCRPYCAAKPHYYYVAIPSTPSKHHVSLESGQSIARGEERQMWAAAHVTCHLAEQHNVPPYVIFPDSTLLEMLREQPEDLDDMAQISGVGARKLERYGAAFLKVLNQTEPATSAPATPNSQDFTP